MGLQTFLSNLAPASCRVCSILYRRLWRQPRGRLEYNCHGSQKYDSLSKGESIKWGGGAKRESTAEKVYTRGDNHSFLGLRGHLYHRLLNNVTYYAALLSKLPQNIRKKTEQRSAFAALHCTATYCRNFFCHLTDDEDMKAGTLVHF